MTFDPTKPCTTRDGRKVEVLRVLKNGRIVAVVTDSDNEEWSYTWYRAGNFIGPKPAEPYDNDLINIPVKQVRYVNFYPDNGRGCSWPDVKTANLYACANRIARVRVEFTEGQFDE